MNIEHFEAEFPDFYVDFGSQINPSNPYEYKELIFAEDYDGIIKKAEEENTPDVYYVRLTWKTLEIGKYKCSAEEYNSQTIPATVIEATKSYKPPVY